MADWLVVAILLLGTCGSAFTLAGWIGLCREEIKPEEKDHVWGLLLLSFITQGLSQLPASLRSARKHWRERTAERRLLIGGLAMLIVVGLLAVWSC